jgi:hypothetical protein
MIGVLFWRRVSNFRQSIEQYHRALDQAIDTLPPPSSVSIIISPPLLIVPSSSFSLLSSNATSLSNNFIPITTTTQVPSQQTPSNQSVGQLTEDALEHLLSSLIEANDIYNDYIDIGAPNHLDLPLSLAIQVRATLDYINVRCSTHNNLVIRTKRQAHTTRYYSEDSSTTRPIPTISTAAVDDTNENKGGQHDDNNSSPPTPAPIRAPPPSARLITRRGVASVAVSSLLTLDEIKSFHFEVREAFNDCSYLVVNNLDGLIFQRFRGSEMFQQLLTGVSRAHRRRNNRNLVYPIVSPGPDLKQPPTRPTHDGLMMTPSQQQQKHDNDIITEMEGHRQQEGQYLPHTNETLSIRNHGATFHHANTLPPSKRTLQPIQERLSVSPVMGALISETPQSALIFGSAASASQLQHTQSIDGNHDNGLPAGIPIISGTHGGMMEGGMAPASSSSNNGYTHDYAASAFNMASSNNMNDSSNRFDAQSLIAPSSRASVSSLLFGGRHLVGHQLSIDHRRNGSNGQLSSPRPAYASE